MTPDSQADKIRAALDQTPVESLVKDTSVTYADVWAAPNKKVDVFLASAKPFRFRDSLSHIKGQKPLFQWGEMTLGTVHLRFCTRRWISGVYTPGRSVLFPGLNNPQGLVLNIAIEQINCPQVGHREIPGLQTEDTGKIADFIRRAMQQYLDDWLTREREIQERYGRRAVPVAGKIHENWRDPLPFIAEFNQHICRSSLEFSLESISGPLFERYEESEENGRTVIRVEGEQDVWIEKPRNYRDEPRTHKGAVHIGELRIPIDLEDIDSIILSPPRLDAHSTSVKRVNCKLLLHPLSSHLEPLSAPPAGLDMATANRAVEHMRAAWTKAINKNIIEVQRSKGVRSTAFVV